WEEMEWEAALALVGERLAAIRGAHGKDAIAMYYGNPNGHNFGAQIYTQLFISLLETQRFFSAGSVDQQPKNLSCELLYGSAWTFPIPDLDRSDFFVCMGANPLVSQGSLMSAPDAGARFSALRARGGKLVVIDPRRSETAAAADWHLFIRPGTDAFLLFALVKLLFDGGRVVLGHLAGRVDGLEQLRALAAPFTPEAVQGITGVAAADIRRLCEQFCAAEKPVIYGRIGLCTQEFGTLASWLVDVVNLLRGRLDAEGGAMFPRPATGQGEDSDSVGQLLRGRWHSKVRGFPEYMSMLPATLMAEELAWDGPDRVRALITVAGNPVLSVPNGDRLREAMDGLEFVVALDIYINETTSRADVILPSAVQLEHSNYDFLFQSTTVRNFARYSPRVLVPEPGVREQWQLMLEVCGRVNGLALEQLDTMIFEGLAERLAAATGVAAVRIRELAGPEPGPERLLDMMLRAGPCGDRFQGGEGLTLARLAQAEHGIDLGPLMPGRLPGILRTQGKRIRLLHPLLEADIARLCARLDADPGPGLLLIGRRHVRDMNSWLHNLPHFVRGKNRCTLRMHPDDAAARSLADGDLAIVRSAGAEREVPVETSDEMMRGVVSLPHGFGHRHADTGQPHAQAHAGVSANDLVGDGLDLPSGTSVVNGVPVEVRAAST
ncbi:MAG: molybdopterin-dependent oxidoreductase, partial [Pseudomonadales bacterium]|nr:molybdopterin-dependent oxidoreductase [Pseudomonadales bacterium]